MAREPLSKRPNWPPYDRNRPLEQESFDRLLLELRRLAQDEIVALLCGLADVTVLDAGASNAPPQRIEVEFDEDWRLRRSRRPAELRLKRAGGAARRTKRSKPQGTQAAGR